MVFVLDWRIQTRPSRWLPAHGDPDALREGATARVRRWVEARESAGRREPHPAPEVPCRGAAWSEMSANGRKLAELALSLGWLVVPTYARGTVMQATGKPGKVVDSIAIRMRRGGFRAVAVYHDGLAQEAFIWTPPGVPLALGVTALGDRLAELGAP